jgi:tagaturonate reductase
MKLSKHNLNQIPIGKGVSLPKQDVFLLPEKVLQFGTGVFVRGLIDYIIDKANNCGEFNGRVIMVKSTNAGSVDTFREQDNLYTLIMKSNIKGVDIEDKVICAAVNRVIDAATEWSDVLVAAASPDLKVVISNTTEVGIVLIDYDSITHSPPLSFPGKLLSFLYERYKIFNGSAESGMVIIPTELIVDNATILKEILNTLAIQNKLGDDFIEWLNNANEFCNSLVDRIVPGKLSTAAATQTQIELGYEDDLMIMSETFGLWAIETDSQKTRDLLSFSKTFPRVHLVPNIAKFRELKLRLLNGSHNLSCAIGFMAGFHTVKEAMTNPIFDGFMQKLINHDIANAILSDEISKQDTLDFGNSVLDRYRNPYIEFRWLDICLQDTAKIRIRCVPIVLQHHTKYGFVPDTICVGFAAYICFMNCSRDATGQYLGWLNSNKYIVIDDLVEKLSNKWNRFKGEELVRSVLNDRALWGVDLDELSGFTLRVTYFFNNLLDNGFFKTAELVK